MNRGGVNKLKLQKAIETTNLMFKKRNLKL